MTIITVELQQIGNDRGKTIVYSCLQEHWDDKVPTDKSDRLIRQHERQ